MIGRPAIWPPALWPVALLASVDASLAVAQTGGRVQGMIAGEAFEARVICEGPGSDGFFEIVPAEGEAAGAARLRMSGSARIGLAAVSLSRDEVTHEFTASDFEIADQRLSTTSSLTDSATGERYEISLEIDCDPEAEPDPEAARPAP